MFRHVALFRWKHDIITDHETAVVEHPAHQRVLSEYIRPFLAERAAIQYEC